MIDVIFRDVCGTLELTVEGHAAAAPEGKDLFCAGATVLAYTLAQNVRDARLAMRGRPKIKIEDGSAVIRCRPKERYRELVRHSFGSFARGYEMLAHNFPDVYSYKTISDRKTG